MQKSKKIIIGIVLGVLLFFGGLFSWVVGISNDLIESEAGVDNSWAQVENVLQRRYDLVPNLVSSVEGSMKQEEKIFTEITDARRTVSSAESVEDVAEANAQLDEGLKVLVNVIHESYPQLASSDNIKDLMTQLEGTENRIAVERQRFNDTVTKYNVKIRKFPTNIIAATFGYEERNLFESTEGASVTPEVTFGNGGE